MTPNLIKQRDVSLSSIQLAKTVELHLNNRVWRSNLADTNPDFARHMFEFVYRARVAHLDSIDLLQLPENSLVYGGGHFVAAVNDSFIEEQWPPYVDVMKPSLAEMLAAQLPTYQVRGEKLLIGRYGISTWGHWIGELLPKILMAEDAFPERFQYVLPASVIGVDLDVQSIWTRILESLTVCRIDRSRVYPLEVNAHYRFERLFAVSSVWSDYMMHPAASQTLRHRVQHIRADGPQKLAVVRHPRFRRIAANADEVYALLAQRGYVSEATGLSSFSQQVARFKAADAVFGILGSDLTNLLFSPQGVDLVSIAPDVFGDRFFYAIILDRDGTMADIRGPIVEQDKVEHKSTFSLDLVALEKALDEDRKPG